jgi:hypothetical protein
MSELDDLEIARRLRAHYRDSAIGDVPISLLAEVRAMHTSPERRSRPRARTFAAGAAVLVLVVGAALAVGRQGVTPPSSTSAAPSLAPVDSAPAVTPAPSHLALIDAEVPVLRGAAIPQAAVSASNDSAFLIGGGLSFVLADCLVPKDFPKTPLLSACGDGLMISGGGPLVGEFEQSGLTFLQGDVVLRVHVHDERAADCPSTYRPRCERALVVEQVVWRPGANGSDAIPATMSILPPQLEAGDCSTLSFKPAQCVAVVERARSIGSIPWPDVAVVRIERMNPRAVSLGSEAIASVLFQRLNGIETRIDVRCRLTDLRKSACASTEVQPVEPSPTR